MSNIFNIFVKYTCHMEQNVAGPYLLLSVNFIVLLFPPFGELHQKQTGGYKSALKLFQKSVRDFLAGRHLLILTLSLSLSLSFISWPLCLSSVSHFCAGRLEKMDTDDKTVKEKSKYIVHLILKNALEQIGVIHVITCHKLYKI